jgi:dihydrofolate synthase/folylpolyglutamate synthase
MGKTPVTPTGAPVPARPVAVRMPRGRGAPEDFAGAVRWLTDRADVERMTPSRAVADAMKLDRMHALLAGLGDPHRAFRSVHVAGTKGKGSTCEMTAACLEGCGYAVGIYTSPHLVDVRERVRINRQMVPQDVFVRLAREVAGAEAALPESAGEPTFFELITAMAFLHFAQEAVDVAVVEVGLGGRLDSTNVIVPEVCAVTSISLDHTQILGDTVEKIAAEKAGIFKPGVPAVVAPQKAPVIDVFRQAAGAVGAPLAVLGQDIDFSVRSDAGPGRSPRRFVTLSTPRTSYEHLPVPLLGEHQTVNCGLALALLDRLSERGFKVPEDRVTGGLATTVMPGRMEVLRTAPRVMLDGAHNAESVRSLIKSASAQITYESLVVVFGCAMDKDIDGMLRELALGADKIVFTRSQNARAADPRELSRRFGELSGKPGQVAPDLASALSLAKRAAQRDDLICITGSLYLVGEAKALAAKGGAAQGPGR